MPDTPSITIVKAFTYRGKREETSNTYHFTGTTPANAAGWKTLADAVIANERPVINNQVNFVRAYGYEAGNELSVAQIDYEAAPNVVLPGTLVGDTDKVRMTPEACAVVRWRTNERNSRKKWIYLRKYVHGGQQESQNPDRLPATYVALLQTWGTKLTDGSLPGGFKYCGPQGAAAGAVDVSPFVGTRELKRRGKRPSR